MIPRLHRPVGHLPGCIAGPSANYAHPSNAEPGAPKRPGAAHRGCCAALNPDSWYSGGLDVKGLQRLSPCQDTLTERRGLGRPPCFHAQQAAEKAIKALYRANNLVFRYSHDLEERLRGLQELGIVVAGQVRVAEGLTDFAREARYPGPGEPAEESDYTEAIALADGVVRWAERQVAGTAP